MVLCGIVTYAQNAYFHREVTKREYGNGRLFTKVYEFVSTKLNSKHCLHIIIYHKNHQDYESLIKTFGKTKT